MGIGILYAKQGELFKCCYLFEKKNMILRYEKNVWNARNVVSKFDVSSLKLPSIQALSISEEELTITS